MQKLSIFAISFMAMAGVGLSAVADHHKGDQHKDRGAHHGKHHMMLSHMDADGDGVVTRDEFMAAREAHFRAMDADNDGQLTLEEFTAWSEQKRAEYRERAEARKGEGRTGEMRERRRGDEDSADRRRGSPERMFNRLDADDDGVVTREEFMAASERMFERMDRDNSGSIEVGERKRGKHGKSDREKPEAQTQ